MTPEQKANRLEFYADLGFVTPSQVKAIKSDRRRLKKNAYRKVVDKFEKKISYTNTLDGVSIFLTKNDEVHARLVFSSNGSPHWELTIRTSFFGSGLFTSYSYQTFDSFYEKAFTGLLRKKVYQEHLSTDLIPK